MLSVFPEWMKSLPMQQQSVLVLALRGPDGIRKHHPCKDVQRAYRGSVLLAAKYGRPLHFGEKADTFMSMEMIADPRSWECAVLMFLESIDELPHHFIAHLTHGAHILARSHPDARIQQAWRYFYDRMVDDAHMRPEPDIEMHVRLGDWGQRHWDGGSTNGTAGAISDVLVERARQIERGYTPLHDDQHDAGEIISAPDWGAIMRLKAVASDSHPNPRDALVQAAAQIIAEIERLDRAAAKEAA